MGALEAVGHRVMFCGPDDARSDVVARGLDFTSTGEDVRAALDAVIGGEPVSEEQRPSIGCNIKWKES